MSRIGKLQISVPAGVTVTNDNNLVTVKGPKGELSQKIASRKIELSQKDGLISIARKDDSKEAKSMHGLYRQLVANMVAGVVTPFTKTIIVKGVGYKVAVDGKKLTMNIGFSHSVVMTAPDGITLTCPDVTTIIVSGISKELVGQTAATIRSKRPVEPYHHYGLRYSTEKPIKKEGKTAGKK